MFTTTERTFLSYINANAEKKPDELCVMTDHRCFTFYETRLVIGSLMKKLYSLGIKRGVTVGLRAVRNEEVFFLYYALMGIGAITMALDPHDPANYLNGSSAAETAFVISNETEGRHRNAVGNWWVYSAESGERYDLDVTSEPYATDEELALITKDHNVHAPSLVLFTSGTTGKKKGVALSEFAFLNHSVNFSRYFYSSISSADMVISPLYHAFGLMITSMAVVLGKKMFFPDRDSAEYYLDCIEKYKISQIDLVPTLYLRLVDEQKKRPRDISSLRSGGIAGGPYTEKQFKFIEDNLGIKLVSTYGMTETCTALTAVEYYKDFSLRSKGVGHALEGVDVKIKDKDGKVITAPCEVGEICAKGYNLMLGYYNDEEATRKAFDEEGYYHTGDLGYVDENGIMFIVGRIKDIIIRGGENLSAQKIQKEIIALEGVKDACVVGLPDEAYGEVVGAAVVGEGITEEGIRHALQKRLGKIEIPAKIVVLKEIPFGSTGKHDKKLVKKILIESQ